MEQAEQDRVEKVLAEHDALLPKPETEEQLYRKTVQPEYTPYEVKQNLTRVIANIIRKQFGKVDYFTIFDCDHLDAEGAPTVISNGDNTHISNGTYKRVQLFGCVFHDRISSVTVTTSSQPQNNSLRWRMKE